MRCKSYTSDLVIVSVAVYFWVMGAQYWLEKGSMCDGSEVFIEA